MFNRRKGGLMKKFLELDSFIKYMIVATLFIASLGLALTQKANASEYRQIQGSVIAVEPYYVSKNIHTPIETCTIQEVPIYSQTDNGQLSGGQILGAIIGGVIGSKVGSGTGKDIAIGTGAVIGSQVGKNSSKGQIVGYKRVNVCNTTYTTAVESVLSYYIVSWEAEGFSGKSRSNRQFIVGDAITINLIAQPVL
jgi:uncharacterized protein YcfJ